jgi:4a-hydroxytetrahydrobiopterin dehydratase
MSGSKWHEVDGKLVKNYSFGTFADALAFVNKVGELAEQVNHHPDICFGWGYVEVSLSTHDAKAITNKDKLLADLIDQIDS